MALPDELLDELLSAHLDDVLSGDERARVERMLSDDPEIGQRLEQLQRQRAVFRQAAFNAPKLPDGFADQVVQAAIERAQEEELRPDHPLQLAATQSSVVKPASDAFWTAQKVAVVAGLAASVLFVGILAQKYGGESDATPNNTSIASLPNQQLDPANADPVHTDSVDTILTPAPEIAPEISIATSDPQDGGAPDPKVDPSPEMIPVEPKTLLADAAKPVPTKSVTQGPPARPDVDSPSAPLPFNMLLVIEVKQSESGHANDAFDQALAATKIEISNERMVDDKLARAVSDNEDATTLAAEEKRVLLLESPAKKLDLLVNLLASDQKGIASIGFTAISAELDAPLLRSIESVRSVDPTKIRHQGNGFPIVSSSDNLFDAWSNELGDRQFAPVRNPGAAQMVSMMASDNGPDQMANILFIVR